METKVIEVKFKVRVGNWPDTRLTKEFVEKRVEELGNNILEAFDETIYDVGIKEAEYDT